MSRIYISYRRRDAAAYAGRLFDNLNRHFGPGLVFMDIQGGIGRGQDFTQAIEAALNTCDVALVMIGRQWATITGPDGNPRLDDPNDWVRVETAAVLRRNVLVIPVLIDGARLPEPASLPEELRPLCRRNVCELTDSRWSYDVGELIKDIERFINAPRRIKLLSWMLETFSPYLKSIRLLKLKSQSSIWMAGGAMALAVLLGIGFFEPNVVRFGRSIPESKAPNGGLAFGPISAEQRNQAAVTVPNPVPGPGKPTASAAPLPRSLQGGHPTQGTRVAGVVAELTRFMGVENLITAEVTFKNTGSEPVKFCLGSWRLIDEKTGETSSPGITGAGVSCFDVKTLAPGATHAAWAKFKLDAASTSKYSLDIGEILNYPFEGLALGQAPLPASARSGDSTQDTKVAGVVAELASFVRGENLITADVTFKNGGSEPVKFCLGSWRLIDEKTGETSSPSVTGGDVSCYDVKTLAPGAAHAAWAKFKLNASSTSEYSLDIERILNRPFERLVPTSSK